jgi:hypothetical protein
MVYSRSFTAAALSCPVGETVQRAVRVRNPEARAFSYLTTWEPEVGPVLDPGSS